MSQYVKDQPSGFVNKIENVAIIGASGQMGGHIVTELLKNSQFKITALTRKGGKSEMPKGIHNIVGVDYDKKESIVESLKGQDILITTLAANAPQDLPNKLVDAAVEAGVRWYIPNDWGIDPSNNESAKKETLIGIGKEQHNQYVSSKGLPWTAMGNGFWYEWSLSGGIAMFGIDIKERKANFYEQGKIYQSTSTWRHSAKAVAALLSLPILPQDENDKTLTMNKWRNDYVNVQSFHLNQRQMLDAVQKVTNTTDSDWEINNVNVQEIWKGGYDRLMNGDRSVFALALYSRTFFPDSPADNDANCKEDMKLLGLSEDESLEDATERTVQMAEGSYVQNFFAKLHSSSN
ncbi:hypothetical protein L7F22_067838 [Adiantum nelumboides]|nr:hypothetical protein [Adiantum nelumboides]